MMCIGVAVSASPTGLFEPVGDDPTICQRERWGSIDARTFRSPDGRLWLHWKSDDNADVEGDSHSSIYAQELAPDGVTLVGEPRPILDVDSPWEGRIVEASHMVEVDGAHWLFYSGNWFNQAAYAIGLAKCDGPVGPCIRRLISPGWPRMLRGSVRARRRCSMTMWDGGSCTHPPLGSSRTGTRDPSPWPRWTSARTARS
jgi:Glycosyl hydrolases family 43